MTLQFSLLITAIVDPPQKKLAAESPIGSTDRSAVAVACAERPQVAVTGEARRDRFSSGFTSFSFAVGLIAVLVTWLAGMPPSGTEDLPEALWPACDGTKQVLRGHLVSSDIRNC